MRRFGRWTGRLLLATLVAAAWAAWVVLPPRPVSEWATTSRLPVRSMLTKDRTRLVCEEYRMAYYAMNSTQEYGPVRMWDLASGRELVRAFDGPRPYTMPIGFRAAPDGSWLLVGNDWSSTFTPAGWQLFDPATGGKRGLLPSRAGPGRDLDRPLSPVVSANGQFVAYRERSWSPQGGMTRTVVQLTATGEVVHAIENSWPLTFSSDDRILVTGEQVQKADNSSSVSHSPTTGWKITLPKPALQSVSLWDTQTWRRLRQFRADRRFPSAAGFSRDGRWLAVALPAPYEDKSTTAQMGLWNLESGDRVAAMTFDWPEQAWSWPINVEFSPNGSLLVVASDAAPRRHVWDLRNSPPREIPISNSGPSGSDWSAAPEFPQFSADGGRFVLPGSDLCTPEIRETDDPDHAVTPQFKFEYFGQPDFSADGRTLATIQHAPGSDPWKPVRFWINKWFGRLVLDPPEARSQLLVFDAASGRILSRNTVLPAPAMLLGFAADGRSLWTMTYLRPALSPGALLRHANGQASYEPDGTMLVQQWSVPTELPPWWLLTITVVAAGLVVIDWRRSRRRRKATP